MTIKESIICTGIDEYAIDADKRFSYLPKAGDVALFEIISIGKHKAMQDVSKRNVALFPGDRILAAFGNRYATSQFEGYVPAECREEYHMLAQGGVVGLVRSAHVSMPEPTVVKILGYAVDPGGRVINTVYHRKQAAWFTGRVPDGAKIILSLGASMDSGKTTTAGYLIRGLKAIGKRVAYLKLTGTVYTKDRDFCGDCGADYVADFSNLGFPSTYLCKEEELLDLYQTLLNGAAEAFPDYIVVEVADGLYQRETNALLRNKAFTDTVHKVIFSALDSIGAVAGSHYLATLGLPPLAVSGRFTMSPLLMEEVKSACPVRSAALEEIASPDFARTVDAAEAAQLVAR